MWNLKDKKVRLVETESGHQKLRGAGREWERLAEKKEREEKEKEGEEGERKGEKRGGRKEVGGSWFQAGRQAGHLRFLSPLDLWPHSRPLRPSPHQTQPTRLGQPRF